MAGRNFGGAKKGDTNYVIFKPEDMRITEHTKFSIKTYHGSQASFDHFDHSFMGSGEGAQAYGWGTYVSEVKGIAKAYAKQNTAKRNTEYTKAKSAYESALADIDFHNNILDRELGVLCDSHILRLEDNIVGIIFLCTSHDGSSRIFDYSKPKRREELTCSLWTAHPSR